MSHHDYIMSIKIAMKDFPFYALIMAAMRQADSNNLTQLRLAFPETYKEFEERYHARGGKLASESRYADEK